MRRADQLGDTGQMPRSTQLSCLLVDDSPDFLDAARNLLVREGISIVGVASSSAEALLRAEEVRPDVILVDINLGEEDGFGLAEQLHRDLPPGTSPVILISTHAAEDFVDLINASPAVGFVAKSALSAVAIRDILDGLSGPRGT
jgi:DNA-binding NarL/FixJ family response regulator